MSMGVEYVSMSGPETATWRERAGALSNVLTVGNLALLVAGTTINANSEEHTEQIWRLAAVGIAGFSGQIASLFGNGLGNRTLSQLVGQFTPFCKNAAIRAAITSAIAGTVSQVALGKWMDHELGWTTLPVSLFATAYGSAAGGITASKMEIQRAREDEAHNRILQESQH